MSTDWWTSAFPVSSSYAHDHQRARVVKLTALPEAASAADAGWAAYEITVLALLRPADGGTAVPAIDGTTQPFFYLKGLTCDQAKFLTPN